MTLEQLRRAVGRKVGMTYADASEDRNVIDQWINDAVKEVLIRTQCYIAAADVQTTADEWQYDLSTSIMTVTNLWRDGETTRAIRVSPEEILEFRRSNGDGISASDLRWAMAGKNMLLLWPTPTEVYDIDLLYVPVPSDMSQGTDDPSDVTYGGVPAEYHKAIELRALADASDHEHEQGTQRGVNYLAQYDEYLKRVMLPGLNRKGGSLPRVRLGYRNTVRVDNGRYP